MDRLRRAGLKGTIIEIAERLVEQPAVTASAVAKTFDVTFQTANRAIARLVEEGILEEATGKTYSRVFVAREVFRLMRLGSE